MESYRQKAFEKILQEKSVPITEITSKHDNRTVEVGGIILDSREITTKNGQKMVDFGRFSLKTPFFGLFCTVLR